MRFFIQILAGLGVAAFFIGAGMKILGAESLLNAAPVAWWRGAMAFLTIGMLYELIEIRDTLQARFRNVDHV